MMEGKLFQDITEKDKVGVVQKLVEESAARPPQLFLLVASSLMAAFGLLQDNATAVIGSMLLAPLLAPILGFSMGVVMADGRLIAKALRTLGIYAALVIAAAAVVTFLFAFRGDPLGVEVLSRTSPSLFSAGIAVAAGAAVAYALMRPELSAAIPGVAIAVAVLPPLAVVGVTLARGRWDLVGGAFLLFLVNAAGIVFASMVIFSLMRIMLKRGVAEQTLDKVERGA